MSQSPNAAAPPLSGQHRTFHLSPTDLEEERILLELTETKDLPSAFRELLNPICTVLYLMEKVDLETEISGYDLVCIAELLKYPLDKLERMQGMFDSMKLINVHTLSA